ncbi:MAG: hypothetical protein KC442_12020, partial [Thermomicrobiales bacterium]|nr:hypothetical protein [Thermomicrobiales bacterium]
MATGVAKAVCQLNDSVQVQGRTGALKEPLQGCVQDAASGGHGQEARQIQAAAPGTPEHAHDGCCQQPRVGVTQTAGPPGHAVQRRAGRLVQPAQELQFARHHPILVDKHSQSKAQQEQNGAGEKPQASPLTSSSSPCA